MNNTITQLFGIKYPLIQAGMIWCSGWELASAVSNAGGLGIIGSGSMYPDVLREHIQKCQAHTDKPFAVNLPLLYPQIDDHISILIEEGVKVVFTSAGNPAKWTSHLKKHGITSIDEVRRVFRTTNTEGFYIGNNLCFDIFPNVRWDICSGSSRTFLPLVFKSTS